MKRLIQVSAATLRSGGLIGLPGVASFAAYFVASVAIANGPGQTQADESAAGGAEAVSGAAPFMRGIALGLHSAEADFDYGPLIREIRQAGANWIALFFTLEMESVAAVEIVYAGGREWQWEVLGRAVRQARAEGLKTLIFPITVLKSAGDGEWRGAIWPADREQWHRNYRRMIVRLAGEARRLGVDGLAVGSEFCSMEGDREQWLGTIAAVREIFPGMVIYSANWDHYDPVTFWDAVDAIAISGYYELSSVPDPTLEALRRSWERERDALLAWRERTGLQEKPILFSEIGYPNLDGCSTYPWDYTREAPSDPEEQGLCYRAFIETWRDVTELSGAFFYNWWYDGREGEDKGYSPRGKPAEAIMRQWFGEIGEEAAGAGGSGTISSEER